MSTTYASSLLRLTDDDVPRADADAADADAADDKHLTLQAADNDDDDNDDDDDDRRESPEKRSLTLPKPNP